MFKLTIFLVSIINYFSNLYAEPNHFEAEAFGRFEYGFISVLQHKSQWGKNNPEFNYVKDGGQNLLFPTWRAEVGVVTSKKHMFGFLYQPIFAETEVVLENELKLDDVTFPKGTDLLVTYDFPFYRFSYWYLVSASESMNLWVGGGLQLRNANIKFRDRSGTNAFRTSSLGPVPLLNVLMDNKLTKRISFRTAATGFWAPIKYLNGGKTDVNGWIYEVEMQSRLMLEEGWGCYSGLRILGGGAIGNAKTKRISGGTYNKDILLTTSLTAGIFRRM